MENIIFKYFDLSTNQKQQILLMKDIYSFWNKKVNLISRKDFPFFYEKHVLHSLSISKVFQFKKTTHIMDLGTGGGFPGVPLAIFFPQVQFQLVDSISKKTRVLNEIIKELKLKNVVVINKRAEDINDNYDFIVTRAVASLDQLKRWTLGKISTNHQHSFKNGLICLKGGDLSFEIKGYKKQVKIFDLDKFFKEDFFSQKKIVYVVSKK